MLAGFKCRRASVPNCSHVEISPELP
jgi:hypothetical protein